MENTKEFDWVQARYDCSSQEVFKLLESDARQSVEKRNALPRENYGFKVIVSQIGEFSVMREANRPYASSVTFVLLEDEIVVQDSRSQEVRRARLTLNKDKKCVLVSNGEEMDRWRFLCKALEGLFFVVKAETR
ncbi:MAG TPA: hypothetical protein VGK48_03800 [Terriglobia bacterium]|jgi:hypothetical protein